MKENDKITTEKKDKELFGLCTFKSIAYLLE
jgi:hypothetical protein